MRWKRAKCSIWIGDPGGAGKARVRLERSGKENGILRSDDKEATLMEQMEEQ
jgi:hypothetical protein